jgi:alkylation response protein AidB-like acyl-CoA dehydrogenase
MKQPGIEVRPIRNMAGEEEFCEVFLNGARTPLSNIVGGLHKGWNVARSLLGFERVWAGSPRKALSGIWRIEDLLVRRLVTGDPALLDRLAQTTMDVLDLQSLYARFANMLLEGDLGPEVSALKIWATETSQRVSELLLEISGEEATMSRVGDSSLLAPFYETRTPTIFSGTNQIQRNILARQVLELP